MTVAVTLGEARRQVLGYLDPALAPRIEWTRYMAGIEYLDLACADGFEVANVDFFDGMSHRVNCSDIPPSLVVVAASTNGIDLYHYPDWAGRGDYEDEMTCRSRGSREREYVVFLLDALTLRRVTEYPVANLANEEDIHQLPSHPILRLRKPTASATPTASERHDAPTPVPVGLQPRGTPITTLQFPRELRDTLSAYPLRPGTRWTWRVSARMGAAHWYANRVVERITGLWSTAPDRAIARSEIHRESIWPPSRPDDRTADEVLWRVISPHGVAVFADSTFNLDAFNAALQPTATLIAVSEHFDMSTAVPPEVPLETELDPLFSGYSNFVDEVHTDRTIRTKAGTFRHCTEITLLGGNGWGNTRWFCPGVGYVRNEHQTCRTNGQMIVLTELESWWIPSMSR